MDYRRLTYFLAVVDAGTVTAAAEELRIAQPALSRQMKTMEREMGMQLFEPHGNRLRLTPAGRDFIPVARRLKVETRNAERTISALRSGQVELLRASATVTTIQVILAPFISTLRGSDPMLLTQANHHFEVYDALQRDADFAISPTPPPSGLVNLPIGKVPIRAWVPMDHPWAVDGKASISLEELARKHIILPSHQSVSRFVFDAALAAVDTTPHRISECDDSPTILALVRAGRGVGISTDLAHQELHPLYIRTGGGPPQPSSVVLELALQLAWPPGHYASAVIREIGLRLQGFVRTNLGVQDGGGPVDLNPSAESTPSA